MADRAEHVDDAGPAGRADRRRPRRVASESLFGERHVDWLEAQKHQIQEIGYENYLAQQIHD